MDSDLLPPDGEVRLSGGPLLSNVRAFTDLVGATAVRRAIESLAPDRRAEYEALVPVAWIRATTADLVYAAIAEHSGRDLFEVYPAVVRGGMAYSLRTTLRWLLVMASDAALIRRAPKAFAKGHRGPTLEARLVETGVAELDLLGWPDASELRLLGVQCSLEAVLHAAGRTDIHTTRTRTASGAHYDVRWSPGR